MFPTKTNNDNISNNVFREHPVLWLDPDLFNAQTQNYTSIQHAIQSFAKEKAQIVNSYERQIQRLLTQFSVALKQIEYLEDYRKTSNEHIFQSKYNTPSLPSSNASPSLSNTTPPPLIHYDMMVDHRIDKLNRKMRVMHDEMVNMKSLYLTKMDIISSQKEEQITSLKHDLSGLQQELHESAHKLNQNNIHTHNTTHQNHENSHKNPNNLSTANSPISPAMSSTRSYKIEKIAMDVHDVNTEKYRQIQREYDELNSNYNESMHEIDRLQHQINDNTAKLNEGKSNGKTEDDHVIRKLRTNNRDLRGQLTAAKMQQKIWIKKQRDETWLKAKKKITTKEQMSLKEELHQNEMEQISFNKDMVINRLAMEYHGLAQREEDHESHLQEMELQMQFMDRAHNESVMKLKDEYVQRLHYQRTEYQHSLNEMRNKNHELQHSTDTHESGNGGRMRRGSVDVDDDEKTSDIGNINLIVGLYDGGGGYVNQLSPSDDSLIHSRDDSTYSQISASADEIVPSLLVGMDDGLDDLLTPIPTSDGYFNPMKDLTFSDADQKAVEMGSIMTAVGKMNIIDMNDEITTIGGNANKISHTVEHSAKDTFTFIGYVPESPVSPTNATLNGRGTIVQLADVDEKIHDSNASPSPPEPVTAPFEEPKFNSLSVSNVSMRVRGETVPRSKASMLFQTPLLTEIADDVNQLIDCHSKNDLAEQCCEYEETINRYEIEIEELRESLDTMLSQNEELQTSVGKLKEKNRNAKRKEFDWIGKEKEYKSLLTQYRELRENNAKLTLTYFTLQCEYDRMKRDYDEKCALTMNYGDYQISLQQAMNLNYENPSLESSAKNVFENETKEQFNSDKIIYNDDGDDSDGGMPAINDDLQSNDGSEDEVDMVVGFMSAHEATRSTQIMNINGMTGTSHYSSDDGDDGGGGKGNGNASKSSFMQKTTSSANLRFLASAKNKDELLDDIERLRQKLTEMTETKFTILQSSQQEINRLKSKVSWLKNEQANSTTHNSENNLENNITEIQLDLSMNDMNNNDRKQRKSFGGGTVGMLNDNDHSYSHSKNDLESVAKNLEKQKHSRTQSMANSKYLSPLNIVANDVMRDNDNSHDVGIDEDESDNDIITPITDL